MADNEARVARGEPRVLILETGLWRYSRHPNYFGIATGVFAPDAILIADEKAYRGSAAIQAAMEADMKESPDGLVSWTSDQIRVASSGDLAVETGSFNFDPDGAGKKPAIQGSFVTAWAKVDGQWRAITDAGGENVAAAAP
jgi:ketosteroid isomerase-like protein